MLSDGISAWLWLALGYFQLRTTRLYFHAWHRTLLRFTLRRVQLRTLRAFFQAWHKAQHTLAKPRFDVLRYRRLRFAFTTLHWHCIKVGRLQQGCTSTATSSPSKKHRHAVITAMPIRVGTALPSLFASMGTYGFFCYAYSALKKFEQHAPRAAPCAEKFPMHSNAAVCTHRWSQRTGVDQTTRH